MSVMIIGKDKTKKIPVVEKVISSNRYPLFSRVKNSQGVEIGTVFDYRYSGNTKIYACVVADCNYRAKGMEYMSQSVGIPNITSYSSWYEAIADFGYTASSINQATLDYCAINNITTEMISYCRTLDPLFIGSSGYLWQVPRLKDLQHIVMYKNIINSLDTHYNSSTAIDLSSNTKYISCDPCKVGNIYKNWTLSNTTQINIGQPEPVYKDRVNNPDIDNYLVIPILELPM